MNAVAGLHRAWMPQLAGWMRARGHELAGIRRHAFTRQRPAQPDDAAMRELGMSRSQFASYRAESQRLLEQSRRRVLDGFDATRGV